MTTVDSGNTCPQGGSGSARPRPFSRLRPGTDASHAFVPRGRTRLGKTPNPEFRFLTFLPSLTETFAWNFRGRAARIPSELQFIPSDVQNNPPLPRILLRSSHLEGLCAAKIFSQHARKRWDSWAQSKHTFCSPGPRPWRFPWPWPSRPATKANLRRPRPRLRPRNPAECPTGPPLPISRKSWR